MQIRNAAGFYRLSLGKFIIKSGHEDDWYRGTRDRESAPQLNSGHAAQMNIQDEAACLARGSAVEERFGRSKWFGLETSCAQQTLEPCQHTRIILHERHHFPLSHHD